MSIGRCLTSVIEVVLWKPFVRARVPACVAACVCEEKQKLTKLLIYAITGAIGEVTRIFFWL